VSRRPYRQSLVDRIRRQVCPTRPGDGSELIHADSAELRLVLERLKHWPKEAISQIDLAPRSIVKLDRQTIAVQG
jgi:hypothetical protein